MGSHIPPQMATRVSPKPMMATGTSDSFLRYMSTPKTMAMVRMARLGSAAWGYPGFAGVVAVAGAISTLNRVAMTNTNTPMARPMPKKMIRWKMVLARAPMMPSAT